MNRRVKEFFKLGFVLAVVHFLWHTSVKDIKEDDSQNHPNTKVSHKQDSTKGKIR